jgi:hypothetical protein
MSFTLQHNCPAFITNHNIACSTFIAYHIYVRVILAFGPKMAPISKKHRKKAFGTPPSSTRRTLDVKLGLL